MRCTKQTNENKGNEITIRIDRHTQIILSKVMERTQVKNSSTQKVATKVNVSGKLDNPNLSTWQAVLQFVENGFIEAILPGFDRQTAQG